MSVASSTGSVHGASPGERAAARVLVVDDDAMVAESLAALLSEVGHETLVAYDGASALGALDAAEKRGKPVQVVVSDVSMPGGGGLGLLAEASERFPSAAFVMLTGYGTIETAVDALRAGAVDFLTKPVMDTELEMALERALRQSKLAAENRAMKAQLASRFGLGNIVGADPRMKRVYELIEAVAPSKTTVLMSGESGTGKSLIARAIHQNSPRSAGPFVEISCGSIPETLLESELFGHVKGAFTGAHADKAGRFLAANGGTIFLDEINSASQGMQLKLLRVLQERKFEPVGSAETLETDARVVLASNQPLDRLVAEGSFRQDLYYRINVVRIELPPLRERVSDIPMLAEHFLRKHAEELGRSIRGFDEDALDALRRYAFPGNVRELENVIERAAVLSRGESIGAGDLPPEVAGGDGSAMLEALTGQAPADDGPWEPMPLIEALKPAERRILVRALEANQWNRQQTADELGINRTTLYKKMKSLGIDPPDGSS